MPIPREDLSADHANDCPETTAMPQGQPIGGEEARVFLHAGREKAQSLVYLAPRRDPSIVAALKKEYQDFYESIGFSRTAEQVDTSQECIGSCEPGQEAQASGKPRPLHFIFTFNVIFVSRNATPNVPWN